MAHKSILSAYSECLSRFIILLQRLADPNIEASSEQLSTIPILDDQRGRFRAWAVNVGAHRDDSLSLDHKLREAPHIRQKVLGLLGELETDLQEGCNL